MAKSEHKYVTTKMQMASSQHGCPPFPRLAETQFSVSYYSSKPSDEAGAKRSAMTPPARRRERPKRWQLSRHPGLCAGARSAARPKREGGGAGETALRVRGRQRDPGARRPGPQPRLHAPGGRPRSAPAPGARRAAPFTFSPSSTGCAERPEGRRLLRPSRRGDVRGGPRPWRRARRPWWPRRAVMAPPRPPRRRPAAPGPGPSWWWLRGLQ